MGKSVFASIYFPGTPHHHPLTRDVAEQFDHHTCRIAALLDPETSVPTVTDLNPAPNLKGIAELTVRSRDIPVPTSAGPDRNVRAPDLALTAGWGRTQKTATGEITMPGPGKTTPGTRGEGFLDIHLNATTRPSRIGMSGARSW